MLELAFPQLQLLSVPLPVAAPYSEQHTELPSGPLTLHYQRQQSAHGSEIRYMRMQGQKVDVQTLFIYPPAAHCAPVWAAETVTLGQRATVLVLDTPVLYSQSHDRQTQTFLASLQDLAAAQNLQSSTDVPAWYADCRSGSDVFIRPSADTAEDIGKRFSHYILAALALYTQQWLGSCPVPDCTAAQSHQQAMTDYKHHHQVNSPGVPLMSRCFGTEWTQGFMQMFFCE